ncbi:MAG TPA: alcohol dehydrogenase catalytic domain-containing protein [Blastocatellia bacterium]|nr:alcohol dehydrogenase catalytic domain-containing protein [Blastocatellia bacterium]
MKALKKLRLDEDGLQFTDQAPEPKLHPAEVRIRVLAAGICGTDFGIYHSSTRKGIRDEMLRYLGDQISNFQPLVIGHEFCGEVVEIGAGVPKDLVSIGDYVTSEMHIACGYCHQCMTGRKHVCQNVRIKGVHLDGTFADYVCVPFDNLINLERFGGRKMIPPRFGAFLDALGNAVHTVMEGDVSGKTVAILGCGTQGMMATAVARALGATRIYVTDFSVSSGGIDSGHLRRRFEIAREMGADSCFDTNEKNSPGQKQELFERARDEHGGGVDVVLEMSGAEAAYNDAGTLVKNGGQIMLLGIPSRPLSAFDVGNHLIWKGVTMRGIFGRRMFETWYTMLDLLAADKSGLKAKLEKIIAREPVLLENFERGFEMVRSQEAVKVLLTPDPTFKTEA